MKRLLNEVRRFQKIAGLLKEDDYDMGTPSGDTDAMNIAEVDIDLSTTPRFNQEPNLSDKDFLNFVWDSIKDDWIEHKFSTMDPASRRGAVEQFLNSIPYRFLRDYWDDYIERKRRGIEENDIDLSDTPEFFSEPDMWDESFRSFVWDIVGDHYEELYGTIDLDDIDDIIGQYLMNLPYDKLKALWGDYTKHKRTGLKESNIDLSDTPEFTDEKKQFYVYDIEGMEAPFGPFTQEKAYKVMKKLKNDSGEDYGVVNGKVAREIWGLQEDIDLSDIPKFNEGSFKAVFRPLLRREGIQDDRYYNLVLHGYMENELLKKVKGRDIPEVYEKIVTDYDWAGRGNVQHLEDAIENLGIEEGFPEGCLEPSPSGGIVSLLVSEDTVLDIVEAPLKEDIDLSNTPEFSSLPSAEDVIDHPSFTPFMDNGGWEYDRFGFAEIRGKVYYIPDLEAEDEMEVTPLRKGISLSQLISIGKEKGYFSEDEYGIYFDIELEMEIDQWINSLTE